MDYNDAGSSPISDYRKIPLVTEAPPYISLSKYKPPPPPSRGGLYLEIALKYKVKQSKKGKFPFNYKAHKFPSEYKQFQK